MNNLPSEIQKLTLDAQSSVVAHNVNITTFQAIFKGVGNVILTTMPITGVNSRTIVTGSICEYGQNPFGGESWMSINNLIPNSNGTVTIYANIIWSNPLACQISLALFNPNN
jgi:hypothetical protein